MNFRDKFKRKKRGDTSVEEFDITSLLDILVILLVFLLTRYDANTFKINLTNNLELPMAFQKAFVRKGEVLQVNANSTVYLNGEVVGSIFSARITEKLKDKLILRSSAIDKELKDKKKEEGKIINLVLDRTLPYRSVDKILGVAAETGFTQYKLIVKEDK